MASYVRGSGQFEELINDINLRTKAEHIEKAVAQINTVHKLSTRIFNMSKPTIKGKRTEFDLEWGYIDINEESSDREKKVIEYFEQFDKAFTQDQVIDKNIGITMQELENNDSLPLGMKLSASKLVKLSRSVGYKKAQMLFRSVAVDANKFPPLFDFCAGIDPDSDAATYRSSGSLTAAFTTAMNAKDVNNISYDDVETIDGSKAFNWLPATFDCRDQNGGVDITKKDLESANSGFFLYQLISDRLSYIENTTGHRPEWVTLPPAIWNILRRQVEPDQVWDYGKGKWETKLKAIDIDGTEVISEAWMLGGEMNGHAQAWGFIISPEYLLPMNHPAKSANNSYSKWERMEQYNTYQLKYRHRMALGCTRRECFGAINFGGSSTLGHTTTAPSWA